MYVGKSCFVLASIQHFNGFMYFHMQYLNAVYLGNEGKVSLKKGNAHHLPRMAPH